MSDLLHLSELANYESGKVIDYRSIVSQESSIASYDINISGANKRIKYMLSAAYLDEKGLYLNDNMKRVTFRSKTMLI